MIEDIKAKGIILDRIINVAGVDIQKAFTDYTEEKLLFQLRVNAEATLHLTHSLLFLRAEKLEIITEMHKLGMRSIQAIINTMGYVEKDLIEYIMERATKDKKNFHRDDVAKQPANLLICLFLVWQEEWYIKWLFL
jgi:short-subunit dehydrogenase involved in D-alanine esterification of teichoic acids